MTPNCKEIAALLKRDEYISDMIDIKINSEIVAKLLPQTDSSFEITTLAQISDFCTDEEHVAIFDRYLELFDATLSANDTDELGNLLVSAANWNSDPSVRFRLTEVANKAIPIERLLLFEKRVNQIAAEIYTQIDSITGKYTGVEEISA